MSVSPFSTDFQGMRLTPVSTGEFRFDKIAARGQFKGVRAWLCRLSVCSDSLGIVVQGGRGYHAYRKGLQIGTFGTKHAAGDACLAADAREIFGIEDACRECGCTQSHACDGGCWWVAPNLCSSCAAQEKAA